MKSIIISYSLTGNNDIIAKSVAAELGAKHIKISEPKTRTMGKIVFDILFNRTPQVDPIIEKVEEYDLVIFMAPVWLGQVATPLRAYFKQFKDRISKYAFVTICGGAEGPNTKLASELKKRMGKEPAALIEMHIADLLPPDSKPQKKDTMDYHLNDKDVQSLTSKIVKALRETMAI